MAEPIGIEVEGSLLQLFEQLDGKFEPATATAVLDGARMAGAEILRAVDAADLKDTGTLRRSFLKPTLISGKFPTISAGAFSDLIYANIHDQGGTIEPVKTKMLAIPLTPRARKRKSPRTGWPTTGDKRLFLWESAKGNLLLSQRVGSKKKGKLVNHYVLKDSTKITATHYLDKARKKADPEIQAHMTKELQKMIGTVVKSG